jgi:hypothetical protein
MAAAEHPVFNDDPELLAQTVRIFATALARYRADIAAGIPTGPPAYCQCTAAARAASRQAVERVNAQIMGSSDAA